MSLWETFCTQAIGQHCRASGVCEGCVPNILMGRDEDIKMKGEEGAEW